MSTLQMNERDKSMSASTIAPRDISGDAPSCAMVRFPAFWLKVFQAPCVFSESAAAIALSGTTSDCRQEITENNMSKLRSVGATAIASAALLGAIGPAAAKDYEYCRRDETSFMMQCGFDTLAQCQDTSFGRGGDCFLNPSHGNAANAYDYAPGVRKTYAYAPHRGE